MTEDKDKKPGGLRPGLRALLIGSLALNLVIGGLMAGAVLGNKQAGDRPPREGDVLGAYTRALTKEDRREIGRSIREFHREQGGEGKLGPRKVLEDMLIALRAEPFDAEAVEAVFASQADLAVARRAIAQQVWIDHVSQMSADARAAYADRIVEALSRRRGPPARNKAD